MTIPKLETDLNNIQALSDRPNESDGLTSTELKKRFDQAGNDIKSYLNNKLIPSLETSSVGSTKCNNEFDNPLIARANLKIVTVTSLPSVPDANTIYLKYQG